MWTIGGHLSSANHPKKMATSQTEKMIASLVPGWIIFVGIDITILIYSIL